MMETSEQSWFDGNEERRQAHLSNVMENEIIQLRRPIKLTDHTVLYGGRVIFNLIDPRRTQRMYVELIPRGLQQSPHLCLWKDIDTLDPPELVHPAHEIAVYARSLEKGQLFLFRYQDPDTLVWDVGAAEVHTNHRNRGLLLAFQLETSPSGHRALFRIAYKWILPWKIHQIPGKKGIIGDWKWVEDKYILPLGDEEQAAVEKEGKEGEKAGVNEKKEDDADLESTELLDHLQSFDDWDPNFDKDF